MDDDILVIIIMIYLVYNKTAITRTFG